VPYVDSEFGAMRSLLVVTLLVVLAMRNVQAQVAEGFAGGAGRWRFAQYRTAGPPTLE
jgi:hypothetical protein